MFAMLRKARKLLNIDADEISLVDRPANQKKFLIKKQERKIMKEFIVKLKKFIGEEKPLTDEQIAKAETLDATKAKEFGDALDIIQSYKEDYSDELTEATDLFVLKSLFPEEVEPEELTVEDVVSFVTEKAGASLSKATKAQLEKIKGIIDSMLKVKTEKLAGDKEENLSDETMEKLEKLQRLEAEDEERIKKAEEAEKKKAADDNAALLKRIEKLEKEGRSDTTQLKDEGDEGKKKVKKEDETFDWTSLNPKPEKK
jgi:hypothetical protein